MDSTDSSHDVILWRDDAHTMSHEFYADICCGRVEDIKMQGGKLLFPSRIHAPFPTAGLGLVRQDMYDILAHLDAYSTMTVDEAQQENQILTLIKANRVREEMDTIRDLRQQCASLDFQTSLFAHLDSLAEIRAEYYALLPLTFRVNDLPVEILTYIFRIIVHPCAVTKSRLSAAIRISHVCRLWRDIAISDRQLWNPVRFVWPGTFARDFSLLNRAGPMGLEVCIGDPDTWVATTKPILQKIIGRIFQYINGIKVLTIFAQDQEALSVIFDAMRRVTFTIPLKSISIRLPLQEEPPPHVSTQLFSAVSPSLERISLHGVDIGYQFSPISSLTTLELRSIRPAAAPTSAQFSAILGGAAALCTLVLDGAGPLHPPNSLVMPVGLHALKVLVVGGFTGPYFEYVMSHFTSPNVLGLTIAHQPSDTLVEVIRTIMHANPMSKIRVLNLDRVPMDGRPSNDKIALFEELFRTIPDLTFLRLIDTLPFFFNILGSKYTESTILKMEDGNAHSAVVADQLRFLDWQTTTRPTDLDALHRFLESRKDMGKPLEKVWIGPSMVCRLSDGDVVQCLASLAKDGTVAISEVRGNEEAACLA